MGFDTYGALGRVNLGRRLGVKSHADPQSAERTPTGRAGDPRDIAAIAAFLASDRNRFVTGDTIEASGGADRFM